MDCPPKPKKVAMVVEVAVSGGSTVVDCFIKELRTSLIQEIFVGDRRI